MAYLSGTAGSVVYMTGGTAVAGEISEWSLNIGMETVEVTAFGDNWDEKMAGVRSASGSFSGNWDTADATQTSLTNAMLGGSAVALRLFGSGTKYWNVGTAYLTTFETGISQKGKGDASFDFDVSGPVNLV
jgi:hypothetical protein